MKNAVEESVAGLSPGDVFLFFFAGYGFTAQDGAHLLFCRDDRVRLLRVNGAELAASPCRRSYASSASDGVAVPQVGM